MSLAGRTARAVAKRLSDALSHGSLTVTFPDGVTSVLGGKAPGPDAILVIRRWAIAQKVLKGGAVGFAESFMDGDVDCPDLYPLFRLILANQPDDNPVLSGNLIGRFLNRMTHVLRPNSKAGSKKNIYAHYDLGNAFYSLWLDESMTYSSAMYADAGSRSDLGSEAAFTDLAAAQAAKYDGILNDGQISADDSVLEIGCGWGGFAEHAASTRGCHVTGITISQAQYDFAKERIFKAGLNEKVDLRMQDYRDVEHSAFDRVASIEMFEAVGEKYWPVYFGKVRDVLKPGGRAALQIISIEDAFFEGYRRKADFIQKYIFPGGMLPSMERLKESTDAAGLQLVSDNPFGPSYAKTLMAWNERFSDRWAQIAALGFDDRFKRLWQYYLLYCAAGFDDGRINVRQVVLAK